MHCLITLQPYFRYTRGGVVVLTPLIAYLAECIYIFVLVRRVGAGARPGVDDPPQNVVYLEYTLSYSCQRLEAEAHIPYLRSDIYLNAGAVADCH